MNTKEPEAIRRALTLSKDFVRSEGGLTASRLAQGDYPQEYRDGYYDALHAGAVRSAAAIVPFVQEIFAAQRVVDLGCGTGAWLASFRAHGATRILGVDLPSASNGLPTRRAIPPEDFLAWNLMDPVKIDERFDLAVSLEVGEHLPIAAADTYLDSLALLAPVVLFSAAIPDQGGEHHENEQWPAWWADRFKERGYITFDCLRPNFWDDTRVETWYAQNMLLFVRAADLERFPDLPRICRTAGGSPQALVHPRWWVFTHQQHQAVARRLSETETVLTDTRTRLSETEEARIQQECAARDRLQATRRHFACALVGVSPAGASPRALIIIPGSLNYFYDQAGKRIAMALTNLGFHAEVRTLREIIDPVPTYERTFVINIAEVILAYGGEDETARQTGRLDPAAEMRALARLADIREAVGGPVTAVQLDCVQTWWFAHACDLCDYAGIPTLMDLGFHDQSADLTPTQACLYRFVFNGLTESERATLGALDLTAPRPVPWVFVGHMTEDRMRLVRRIMSEVDSSGFVYMPTLAPFTANGPHLNEQQLMRVLGRARYQLWGAHHTYFYLESERFRQSVLAGAVPIKMLTTALPAGSYPFTDFLLDEATFPQQLRAMDFAAMQRQAIDLFNGLPGLEEGLLAFLAGTSATPLNGTGRREHAMAAQNGA